MFSHCDDLHMTKKQHIKFFQRFLHILPSRLSSYDSTRLTIAFFAISGLDILNGTSDLEDERKNEIIEWLYRLQVVPNNSGEKENLDRCGFQGSTTICMTGEEPWKCSTVYKCGHLAMTYTGLASLIILGDNLNRINRKAIIQGVRALQQDDGSFCAYLTGSENDMRFVYCAACICYILSDWTGMDIEKTLSYIRRSVSYDFGIGQGPELESHGGTTFCAVATLVLMDQLETTLTKQQLDGLRRWAIFRQVSGFQGRPNKPVDTCYSFWIGATLKLLGVFDLIDLKVNRRYILSTQDPITGGFSKWVDTRADPLHTYFGLCGLSLMKEKGLLEVHPALNISQRAHKRLKDLQKTWSMDVS
uniref:Geranylgeranyl transferase type-1 subunit beta n=1 Tax=Timema monikensis TaxID=170555 RepID=A0A7R9HKG2_9NEOP|nr:unnamed protein product [Timema monikensis]